MDEGKERIISYFTEAHIKPKIILDIGCYDCKDSIDFLNQ